MTDLPIDEYRAGVESGRFPHPMHTGGGRPPGWFRDDQGTVYAAEAAKVRGGTIVEVGCYMGRSLSWIVPICIANGNAIYAVDPWERCPRSEFERCMREAGWLDAITIVQQVSVAGARMFVDATIDLCFIDAIHDYENVTADIAAWWPKVAPGGTLMGHDYSEEHYGLRQAVDERFGDAKELNAGMWIVRKQP